MHIPSTNVRITDLPPGVDVVPDFGNLHCILSVNTSYLSYRSIML